MSSSVVDIPRIDQRTIPSLARAFDYCETIARKHYENFPVASRFIPKQLRPYVYAVYAYARTADDFADEGTLPVQERLARLDEWESGLERCFRGEADHPVFVALAETIARFGMPLKPFADLLAAFRWDVTRNRFPTFNDLLDYCAHSANPIGQLVLHIFSGATDRTIYLSDNICTALQLANFWQDVSIDWAKRRLYIPVEDIERFGYTEDDLTQGIYNKRFRNLMEFQVERTRMYFSAGRPLLDEAVNNLRFELRLTWLGGMTILKKIEQANFDVLSARPAISTLDKAGIFMKALAGGAR